MADSGTYTPETLARRRRFAEALIGKAVQPRRIDSHLQGVSSLAHAWLAGRELQKVEREEERSARDASEHARRIGRTLLGGQNPENDEAALFNARNPGELQMVETTPQRMPDQYAALEHAMTPGGARALQNNPVLSSMVAQQFRPREAEPLEIIDADGRAVYVPRSQAAGKTPFMQPKGAHAPSSLMQEYDLAKQQGYPGTIVDYQRDVARARDIQEPTRTQLVTRPTADGGLQDFAYNPSSPQLTPVGDPYKKQTALSPKDAATVQQKINQISLAREQIARARERFNNVRGSFSAGPFGQSLLPTESGKAFDAAIDQMRGTISGITRIPGVGAMSDFETRLDQAKFPSRDEYESVTEQKLNDLDAMLGSLEGGYLDMVGGEVPHRRAPASAGPRPGDIDSGYRFKGGDPADPANWEQMR